jgi:hypothetical protein
MQLKERGVFAFKKFILLKRMFPSWSGRETFVRFLEDLTLLRGHPEKLILGTLWQGFVLGEDLANRCKSKLWGVGAELA